jgi:hypothetical protein
MGNNIVAIVGIIVGCSFAGFIFYKIIDLIKAWINRNKMPYDEEKFERLAKAFIQHKKESERRLHEIESGHKKNDAKPPSPSAKSTTNEARKQLSIEVDDNNTRPNSDKESAAKSGTMENMLNKE